MVASILDPSIIYQEKMIIEQTDKNSKKELYQMNIFGVDVLISLGNPINKYYDKNIIYFPIYLIKYNNKALQIGVYEFNTSQITLSLMDDDESVFNLISTASPLLYFFVDRDFLLRLHLSIDTYEQQEKSKRIESEKTESNFNPISIFKKNTKTQPVTLITETEKDAKTYRKAFSSARNSDNLWIQKFMQNIHYGLRDNEGAGDCFFAVIRDAYKTIGLNTTVANLRQLVSDKMTEEQYNVYRELSTSHKAEINNIIIQISQNKEEIKKIKNNGARDPELVSKMKQLQQNNAELLNTKQLMETIYADYRFMERMNTLEDFKNYIKTSSYWADEWAIGQLEIILKIKIIIFSESDYDKGDLLNVLRCQSGFVDQQIEINQKFDPKYYIMTDYSGNHYKLITYKNKAIFTFNELPYDVKKIIVDRCMESMSGIFSYIDDFVNFKLANHSTTGGTSTLQLENGDGQIMEDLYQYGGRKLWDDDVKLYFYNKSGDSPPGKASGEKIPRDKVKLFSNLYKIKNWRKKLDNYWVQPFILDGKTWASVEHYYQASKFKNDNPIFYNKFSIDSKSSLSKNPAKAKKIGEDPPENIHIDSNYDKKRSNLDLYSAQEAKFTQNNDLAKILLETNRANLYYHRKGNYPIQCTNLMIIRKKLQSTHVNN